MRNKKLNIVLCIALITVCVMPLIQNAFDIFKFKPLWDSDTKSEKPKLTFDGFASGKYQAETDKYLTLNYGFREPTIRLHNQIVWDLFKKTNAKDVTVGKNGWLYLTEEAEVYSGTFQHSFSKTNYDTKLLFDRQLRTMKKLNGVLSDFGVKLMVYISPNKSLVYPDNMPDMERDSTTIDAREYFKEGFKKIGIPCLDMTDMYRDIVDTLFYPAFSPGGRHWNFSCVYAADSLFHFIEKHGNTNLAEIKIGEYKKYDEQTDRSNKADYDLEGMLNLMFWRDHSKNPLYSANVTVESDSTCDKPSIIFVGNSFLWRIKDFINFGEVFESPRLWYYNLSSRDLATMKKKDINNVDDVFEILMSDYVVTFCGDYQLQKITFGFAGKTLINLCLPDSIVQQKVDYLCKNNNISRQQALKTIYNNPEVFDELKGDDIPTMRNEKALQKAEIIRNIKSDEELLKSLEEKGKKLNLTIKDMIEKEMNDILNGKTNKNSNYGIQQ